VDDAEPSTGSGISGLCEQGCPLATRIRLASDPRVLNALHSPALNLAGPHGGDVSVLRMPKRTVRGNRCGATGPNNDAKVGDVFKAIPMCGCYRRVRRERLLGENSEDC
jgi:hypothetical protein